jgi:hypothetical protein
MTSFNNIPATASELWQVCKTDVSWIECDRTGNECKGTKKTYYRKDVTDVKDPKNRSPSVVYDSQGYRTMLENPCMASVHAKCRRGYNAPGKATGGPYGGDQPIDAAEYDRLIQAMDPASWGRMELKYEYFDSSKCPCCFPFLEVRLNYEILAVHVESDEPQDWFQIYPGI